MFYGIDCATRLTAKTAQAIKDAGYSFAGRYLVPERGSLKWKALTKAEAEIITGVGMSILAVYETTADRAKGGAAFGTYDGQQAFACAEAIGIPKTGVIYFAVDFGAAASDMSAIAEYLKAARAQIGDYKLGVYGAYNVIEAMAALNLCDAYWQCVGWSYGKISDHRSVYQAKWGQSVAGVSVDINECEDLVKAGIWNYQMEDEDMDIAKLTPEECYEIIQKASEYMATLPLPTNWNAAGELQEAVDLGITDGTRPMELTPRYQAAIMVKRAVKK